MPSPGQSALKFLRSNLRRGAKPKVRIAVLGQASVGKTALIVRYVTKRFIYDYAPEIAKVYQHQTVLDQEEVNMEIWDTAGHFNSSAELRHLEVFVRWADVVGDVFEVALRQGWLYRQHRELTKHRTLTLYPSSSSPAFEKSNSIDNGSIDWLENQPPGNLMPPSPNSYLGNLSPTSSNGSAVGSFSSDGRKLLNLTANASSSTSMSAGSTTAVVTLANSSASSASCSSVNETTRKKLSPIGPSTFKCQSLISNIKKCITPAPPGPSGLTSSMGVADFDGIIIEEHPNNPSRKLFRSRANTDSRLCSRSRSMSMGANMNPFFTIGNETIDNKDDTWKPKRKTSVFFP
ncbi:hypothetical protein TCAL_06036 [Tigriopus californicus]|uniref:small monomeric GTPase n=1 Tax=Tigriopus californicus TaxID=6832 RepID=A0A553P6K9_TIGCA|nr:hypothetical protein TCAL_06036 [Tigriopus californicus]